MLYKLFSGYSMLQGGPLPCFFTENLLMKIISAPEGLNTAERQLKDGFCHIWFSEGMITPMIAVDTHDFRIQ